MNTWGLGLVIGALAATAIAFVWVAIRLGSAEPAAKKEEPGDSREAIGQAAVEDVENIFNEEYREELRNRGRMHFEKVIGENAQFLQQDLRLTTSQINEFMKQEISNTLKEEFAKYQQSIDDIKKMTLESIQKTEASLEEERQQMRVQLENEVAQQKEKLIKSFEQNMGEIVNHYVLDAIGNEINLNEQLGYILTELQENKEAIVEDIRSGA